MTVSDEHARLHAQLTSMREEVEILRAQLATQKQASRRRNRLKVASTVAAIVFGGGGAVSLMPNAQGILTWWSGQDSQAASAALSIAQAEKTRLEAGKNQLEVRKSQEELDLSVQLRDAKAAAETARLRQEAAEHASKAAQEDLAKLHAWIAQEQLLRDHAKKTARRGQREDAAKLNLRIDIMSKTNFDTFLRVGASFESTQSPLSHKLESTGSSGQP